MYLTEAQLNKRLAGFESLEKESKKKVCLNKEEKALLGSLAQQSNAKEVADAFGVSPTVVGNASKGIVSIESGLDKDLKKNVDKITEAGNNTKSIARELALDNLVQSLGIVNTTAPNIKKASEAAQVARSMAEIVDKLDGGTTNSGPKVAIIIHGHSRKEESSYETIEVG